MKKQMKCSYIPSVHDLFNTASCVPLPDKGEVVNSPLIIVMDNTTSGRFAITREEIYEIITSQGLVPQCDCCCWSPRVL